MSVIFWHKYKGRGAGQGGQVQQGKILKTWTNYSADPSTTVVKVYKYSKGHSYIFFWIIVLSFGSLWI